MGVFLIGSQKLHEAAVYHYFTWVDASGGGDNAIRYLQVEFSVAPTHIGLGCAQFRARAIRIRKVIRDVYST